MLRSRSLDRRSRRALAIASAGLFVSVLSASAQTRWIVDPQTSLAWWQMSPNLNHLWATTCPEDPSWRPGENRSPGWHINPALRLPGYAYANKDDTVHVPLFPRYAVQPDCSEAVRGEIVVVDTVTWQGAHGTVKVAGDSLISGETIRDIAMHQALETSQFPEISFTLDSLVGLTKDPTSDTLRGTAVGTLTIRTITTPTVAAVRIFPDAGGMRVLAKWHVSAAALLQLAPAIHTLGLGVNTWIWHKLFMGADLVLHRAAARPSGD